MIFAGPNGKQVAQRVTENGINGFKVDYTPTVGGNKSLCKLLNGFIFASDFKPESRHLMLRERFFEAPRSRQNEFCDLKYGWIVLLSPIVSSFAFVKYT